jgi:modulator of FtsH protease
MQDSTIRTVSSESVLATNKVLKNTYLLLSMTLLFSAAMAAVGMAVQVPYGFSMLSSFGALALIWFVIPRTAHSASGIFWVFAMTGLLGFGLGPILNYYMASVNGSQIVMTAMGGTAVIFLGLSAYALTTRKDFSFMGGMLFAGILVAFLAGIGALIFELPSLSLAVSTVFILLMSGMILFETSRIIHGGETNYIMATVSLYVAIYNIFTSLLHILGSLSGED